MTSKTDKPPIVPHVHLNGDSRQTLLDDFAAATSALRKAIDVVQKTAPNGRNFYNHPEGEGAMARATHEHLDRLRRLLAVNQELLTIAEELL
jgi:hypothetical protein